jgi:hypothetical protein
MRQAVTVLRIVFGLHFFVNGLNFFVPFFPITLPHNPAAINFVKAAAETGIIFQAAKVVEVATGLALLVNRFVPLALVVALPVALNVFFVDVFLVRTWFGGYVLGGGTLLLNALLLLAYLDYYKPMLCLRATPLSSSGTALGRLGAAVDR